MLGEEWILRKIWLVAWQTLICNFEYATLKEQSTYLDSCFCWSCVLVLFFWAGSAPTVCQPQRHSKGSQVSPIYLESRILQENNIRNTYLGHSQYLPNSIFPIALFSRAFCGTDCGPCSSFQAMSGTCPSSKRNNIAVILRREKLPGLLGVTSSTAQGSGGSFKDRKPIGEVGCCESWMADRTLWWIKRW
jgi:hypothetical protein